MDHHQGSNCDYNQEAARDSKKATLQIEDLQPATNDTQSYIQKVRHTILLPSIFLILNFGPSSDPPTSMG